MQNFVAILAAGIGSRMGLQQPKQFVLLNGKTILEHSVDTFDNHPFINGIFVVVHPNLLDQTRRLLKVEQRSKIKAVVAGGEQRADSSWAAISAIEQFCYDQNFINNPQTAVNVLIHDAARPFVSDDIITRTIEALRDHSAVSVAIPATDTIYLCNSENQIESSPQREGVYLAQTPQAARLHVFKQAFEHAQKNEQHPATDDANVVLDALPDEKIYVVLGDLANRKITYSTDLSEGAACHAPTL